MRVNHLKPRTKDALIGVLVIAIIAMVLGTSNPLSVWVSGNVVKLPWLQIEGENGNGGTTTTGKIKGVVTTDTATFDSLDIATVRTIGTNVNVYWYALRSGQWVLLGSGDAADINVQEGDSNVIYAVCSVPSGQSYYVDYNKILSMNSPLVTSVQYTDVDGDGVKDLVFRLDISDIPFASGTGKYTLPSFNVYLITYDSSHSISSPADIVAGTSKVTKYVEWYTTMSTSKKALAVTKIVLVANTSAIEEITLDKLNIPGIGNLDGSNFEQSVLSTETRWTYTISSQLYGADYIELPVNQLNKFQFTTTLTVTLSTNHIQVTLYIYYLTSAGATASLSDPVVIKDA